MNLHVQQLIKENLRTQNPYLDLGRCGLNGTEPELALLAECTHLETLIFMNSITGNQRITLEEYFLIESSFNCLKCIPQALPKNIKKIILSGEWEKTWTIDNIFPIVGLNKLVHLNISSTEIHDIALLSEHTLLERLLLSNNKIQKIQALSKLLQLTFLHLSTNEINDISPLTNLKNLNFLYLGINQIKDISPLKYLHKLSELYLESNQLTCISSLENLTSLQKLNLSFNDIKEIYVLKELKELQSLDLSSNNIEEVSVLKKLKNLKSLNLSYNQVQDFPLNIVNSLPNLKYLNLYHNPIQNIPKEIFDKNENVLQDVRNYLEDQAKGAAQNRVLKVILIGNGSVGKTQIAKRWVENTFNVQHDSTHGIVRMAKEVAGVQLQIWDFAGQDIYHATHRLFMQISAVFFLVWDYANEFVHSHHTCPHTGKPYQNERLMYWLEYAQCFGKGSPILVLQNKVDTEADKDKTYLLTDWEAMKSQYPILDTLQVSAKENEGFEILEYVLEKIFQENETLYQQLNLTLPTSWIAVRVQIEALQSQGQKMLTFEDFEKLCAAQEVKKSAHTIVDYFHNTGLFYYRAGYFNNQIILNQDWAIQAIYQILDRKGKRSKILAFKKGLLEYEDLKVIWTDNTDEERKLFMDFMLSAELCFETTQDKKWDTPLQKRTFIVPHLLPEGKSKEAEFYQQELTLSHTQPYKFLPTVFIQRFIVKAGKFSQIKLMWRAGLLMQTQEGNALVEADYTNKTICIFANTQKVMDKIREELEAITHEGSIKAQASKGEHDDLTAKYLKQMFGLKGLNTKTPQNMNETIQKALLELNNANIAGYFDEMDKVEIPSHLKPIYAEQKSKFFQGLRTHDFYQQLEVFAKSVANSSSFLFK